MTKRYETKITTSLEVESPDWRLVSVIYRPDIASYQMFWQREVPGLEANPTLTRIRHIPGERCPTCGDEYRIRICSCPAVSESGQDAEHQTNGPYVDGPSPERCACRGCRNKATNVVIGKDEELKFCCLDHIGLFWGKDTDQDIRGMAGEQCQTCGGYRSFTPLRYGTFRVKVCVCPRGHGQDAPQDGLKGHQNDSGAETDATPSPDHKIDSGGTEAPTALPVCQWPRGCSALVLLPKLPGYPASSRYCSDHRCQWAYGCGNRGAHDVGSPYCGVHRCQAPVFQEGAMTRCKRPVAGTARAYCPSHTEPAFSDRNEK